MFLVRGGILLTMENDQPIIEDGAVVVDGTDIVAVGPYADLSGQYESARRLGSQNHWVLPGFVNAHNHAGVVSGSFQRGIPDLPLERWLTRLFNSHLVDGQMALAYLNTLHQNAQLIRSGVTCNVDFYYGDGSMPYLGAEHGLQAYQQSGMRVVLVLVAINQPAPDNGDLQQFLEIMPDGLAEQVRGLPAKNIAVSETGYLGAWRRLHEDFDNGNDLIRVFVGPDGPTRCTADFLMHLKETAQRHDRGIQMHLLETKYQRLHWMRENGKSVVKSLDAMGFLGPEVSLAHSIWLTEEDVEMISEARASIVHNPSSNLRLYSGIAPVREMLAEGVNVGLGTDAVGFSDDNDYIEEMRLSALLQRVPGIGAQGLSGQAVLEMATINGARAIGMAERIGSLKPGKRADLIVVSSERMLSPFVSPLNDPREVLWRRARREDVCDVMINGSLVMQGGNLVKIDAADVEEGLSRWYNKLWTTRSESERYLSSILDEADPVVAKFFERYDVEPLHSSAVYNATRP